MPGVVAFLGGNGHCAMRLARARDALARHEGGPPFALRDIPYPGFEGRPRAPSLAAFCDAIVAGTDDAALVYATGIGGLLALLLRAEGRLGAAPLVLQAPVGSGLATRRLPRAMRLGPVRALVRFALRRRLVQARFVRRHFRSPLDSAARAAFFDGYRRCTAFGDLFAWIDAACLDRIRTGFVTRPGTRDGIVVWSGAQDAILGPGELDGLAGPWPVRVFSDWGHYPMLDEPEAWVREVGDALAVARALR